MELAKQLRKFLREHGGKGDVKIPQAVMDDYLEGCKLALETIFEARATSSTLRVSDLGKGKEHYRQVLSGNRPQEKLDYNMFLIFWRGYVFEALGEALLELADLKPQEKQKKVYINVDTPEGHSTTVSGTLDIIVNGELYDIKTANDRSYSDKFRSSTSLAADDKYNYLTQGAAYQEGSGYPFKGWLVINPNTCHMKDVPVEAGVDQQMSFKLEEAIQDVRDVLDGI